MFFEQQPVKSLESDSGLAAESLAWVTVTCATAGWTFPGCLWRACLWRPWRPPGCFRCPWRRWSGCRAVCGGLCVARRTFSRWTFLPRRHHAEALWKGTWSHLEGIQEASINVTLWSSHECFIQQVGGFTSVRWEVGCQVRLCDLLLQQVCFVEEEDGGGLLEPGIREDGLEQGEAFSQAVLKRRGRSSHQRRVIVTSSLAQQSLTSFMSS